MIHTCYQVKITHAVYEELLNKFFHLFQLEFEKDTKNKGQFKGLKSSVFQFPYPILIENLGIPKHGWHQYSGQSYYATHVHPKFRFLNQDIYRYQRSDHQRYRKGITDVHGSIVKAWFRNQIGTTNSTARMDNRKFSVTKCRDRKHISFSTFGALGLSNCSS